MGDRLVIPGAAGMVKILILVRGEWTVSNQCPSPQVVVDKGKKCLQVEVTKNVIKSSMKPGTFGCRYSLFASMVKLG